MEGPLARLVAFEPTTLPVVSVYLNTQPDGHGRTPDTAPYLPSRIQKLSPGPGRRVPRKRHSFDRDVERIVAYAAGQIDPAANGVAIFACLGRERILRGIQLNDACQR